MAFELIGLIARRRAKPTTPSRLGSATHVEHQEERSGRTQVRSLQDDVAVHCTGEQGRTGHLAEVIKEARFSKLAATNVDNVCVKPSST